MSDPVYTHSRAYEIEARMSTFLMLTDRAAEAHDLGDYQAEADALAIAAGHAAVLLDLAAHGATIPKRVPLTMLADVVYEGEQEFGATWG